MKYFVTILAVVISIHYANAQSTQTFINKLWEQQTGTPDTIDWSTTVYDEDGNAYIIGNTTDGFTTDMLVSKVDKYGNVEWSDAFDGAAGLSDYGTAAICVNGGVYTCGTTFSSTTNMFDYVVRVYQINGTLIWSTVLNGASSKNDIASSIGVDEDGRVYVTGASWRTGKDYDYWTVKFDSVGNVLWSDYYDYDSLPDVPVSIIVGGGRVSVAGVSAADSTNWDVYLLNYNYSGVVGSDRRIFDPGVGRDVVTAIAKDVLGNFYLTGKMWTGSDYDLFVASLDNQLNILWYTTYTNENYDDIGSDIKVDAAGNVFVCGNLGKNNSLNNGIVVKYDSDGNVVWHKILYASDPANDNQSLELQVNSSGQVAIASFASIGSDYGIDVTSFDSEGDAVWFHRFNFNNNADEKPKSLKCNDNDGIWYLSYQIGGITPRYGVLAFEIKELNISITTDSLYGTYLSNQLIVRFNPELLNTSFINNKDRQTTTLDEIIPDSVISAMADVTGYDFSDSRNVEVIKIFFSITTADSLVETRLGDTTRLDKFWSAFRLVFPSNWTLSAIRDSLSLLTQYIHYTHPDYIGYLTGNPPADHYYSTDNQQESLHPSGTFPDGHVNIQPAWSIETGKENVRIGIYDEPVYWAHEEFGDGTFAGSKIDGLDYFEHPFGISVSTITNPAYFHGTAVAGIIGAFRNNNTTGIAGISGGDVDDNAGGGCPIYSFGVFHDGTPVCDNDLNITSISIFSNALLEGVTTYDINISNNSWGTYVGANTSNGCPEPTNEEIELLRDVIKSSWRQNCLVVASRGNTGDQAVLYPACYNDLWVLSVGASGFDGELADGNNGTTGGNNYGSSYGVNMDIIAPGVQQIVTTTMPPNGDCTGVFSNGYGCFSGASASAPHATGVAALMMSNHNISEGYANNLAPEDVEALMQHYASEYPTYDLFNGWGLLNAGEILPRVDINNGYRVFHSGSPSVSSIIPVAGTLVVLTGVTNHYGQYIAPGTYAATRYYYSTTTTHTFSNSTQIINWWPRFASTIGTSLANPYDSEYDPYATFNFNVSGNSATVSTTTNTWRITVSGAQLWLPAETTVVKTAYSLHLYDPSLVNVGDQQIVSQFSVSPNPASDIVSVSFSFLSPQSGLLQILDLTGKVCIVEDFESNDKNTFTFDVKGLAQGMYICKLLTAERQFVKQFVKMN